MNNTSYEKTLNLALRMISRRAQSVSQLREKLEEKSPANDEVIEQVINRLLELGYLNDGNFAYQYATNKLNIKAFGRNRLKQALVEKQVSVEVVEQTLSQVFDEQNEEELCEQAIKKYLRIHGKPSDIKENKKIFGHLIRLGFPYDLVIKKIRAIRQDISIEE